MRMPKMLRYYVGYELGVTIYNLAQAKMLHNLPNLPLPSLLTGILNQFNVFGNSGIAITGMNAVVSDGSQFTLGSDAMLSADKQNVYTTGKTYPVLSIQGNTYFLDTPTATAVSVGG